MENYAFSSLFTENVLFVYIHAFGISHWCIHTQQNRCYPGGPSCRNSIPLNAIHYGPKRKKNSSQIIDSKEKKKNIISRPEMADDRRENIRITDIQKNPLLFAAVQLVWSDLWSGCSLLLCGCKWEKVRQPMKDKGRKREGAYGGREKGSKKAK